MPLITIIGVGPGLGLEVARAFGRRGFDVAHLGITALIGGGHSDAEHEFIAEALAKLHDERRQPELHYVAYSG